MYESPRATSVGSPVAGVSDPSAATPRGIVVHTSASTVTTNSTSACVLDVMARMSTASGTVTNRTGAPVAASHSAEMTSATTASAAPLHSGHGGARRTSSLNNDSPTGAAST